MTPGFSASNCDPISVNASVSDAAANTVIDPDGDGDAEPLSPADGVELAESLFEPQPTSTAANAPVRMNPTVERRRELL